MVALFITSVAFFTTLGVAMNIRDARMENFSAAKSVSSEKATDKAA